MSHRASVLLGEATTKVGSGATPRGGEAAYKTSGVPLIRSMNIHFDGLRREGLAFLDAEQADDLKNVEVRARDVLLNITGASIGRVAIAPPDMDGARVNQHVCIIRPTRDLDPSFLRWYLASPSMQRLIHGIESGATRQALTKEKILGFEVPLLSAREQQGIVAEIETQFSRLDEAVGSLGRVRSRLGAYRAGVLQQFFGVEPNVCLADLVATGPQNGLYLPKSAYGSGVPILRIDDYQTDWIRPVADLRQVQASGAQIQAWSLVPGDFVVNRVNSMSHLGKCVSIPDSLDGALFESNMMRLHLKPEALPRYVELYLGSRLGKKRLTENAKWAVNQASINQQDVLATRLPLPDAQEQASIIAEVDRRLSIARGVEAQVEANLKRAQSLRQAVLDKAFAVEA